MEIADIIWLELFSGDLLPENLIFAIQEVKEVVKHKTCAWALNKYIKSLDEGNYLSHSYRDLVRAANLFPESKELLEGVI